MSSSLETKPTTFEIPKVGSVWKHKNGGLYIVTEITNLHSQRLDEYPIRVSYRGENGKVWSRDLNDWYRSMTLHSEINYPAMIPPSVEEVDNCSINHYTTSILSTKG